MDGEDKIALVLNEEQCKIIIRSLDNYCERLATESYDEYYNQLKYIENIANQLPDELLQEEL